MPDTSRYTAPTSRTRVGRCVLALFAVLLAVVPACSAGTEPPLVFQYELTGVGGQALPFQLQSAMADRIEVTGALLVLEPDGSYSLTMLSEITDLGAVSPVSSGEVGTWSHASSQVRLVNSFGGTTITAPVAGATLTIPSYGITLFFGDDASEDFVLTGLTMQERGGQSH